MKININILKLTLVGFTLSVIITAICFSFQNYTKISLAAGFCPVGQYNESGNKCVATNKICQTGDTISNGQDCLTGELPGLDIGFGCDPSSTYAVSNITLTFENGLNNQRGLFICVPNQYSGFEILNQCQSGYYSIPSSGYFVKFSNDADLLKLCVPNQFGGISTAAECPQTSYPVPDFVSRFSNQNLVVRTASGTTSALSTLCVPGDNFFTVYSYPAKCPATWSDAGGSLCYKTAEQIAATTSNNSNNNETATQSSNANQPNVSPTSTTQTSTNTNANPTNKSNPTSTTFGGASDASLTISPNNNLQSNTQNISANKTITNNSITQTFPDSIPGNNSPTLAPTQSKNTVKTANTNLASTAQNSTIKHATPVLARTGGFDVIRIVSGLVISVLALISYLSWRRKKF